MPLWVHEEAMVTSALLLDALLVIGFGVQHSILATLKVKVQLRRFGITPLLWRGVQSFLNVAYIFIAIVLWQDVDATVWDLGGVLAIAVASLCVLGWSAYFYLHLFEYDSGLAFGSSASVCSLSRKQTPKMEMWKVGTRRWIRFPVHTAFFLMFLAIPEMAASTFVFAITALAYNVIGTIFYDNRLTKLGSVYTDYQQVTGNLLPKLRAPRGAADLQFPGPRHWTHPLEYSAAMALGTATGWLYWALLGFGSQEAVELLASGFVALIIAVAAGSILGWLPGSRFTVTGKGRSFADTQTMLATAAAVLSATSLATWFAIAALATGSLPYLPLVLPMWLIVLWFGHLTMSTVAGLRSDTGVSVRSRSRTHPA
jgi:methanethiol S-methyltransferase